MFLKSSTRNFVPFLIAVAAAALGLLSCTASAATITWGVATTISADTDISTSGTLVYAYDVQGSSVTLNTVPFAPGNSATSLGSGNITMSGFSATATSTFNGGSSTPWANLSANYQTVLNGGAYGGTGAATITLNNLTVNHTYQVQVWVNDSRTAGISRNETNTSTGGNTVILAYNSTGAAGGVGQYTIGTFTATATTQAFTMQGNSGSGSSQLNAIQVRDTSPRAYFSGASATVWDASTTADWGTASGGPYNKTWTAAGGGATFPAVFEGTANTVTVNGTVTVGDVTFTTDGYTLGGSGTLTLGNASIVTGSGSDTLSAILGGTAGMTKFGSGTLILSGANTYSGATTLTAGALQFQNASSLPSSAVTMNSGTTLQFRANSGVTFAPASFNESGNGTYAFDVNNNGSGTGQTLVLANVATQFGPASTSPTFNVTGGNNYTLQLGSGSAGTGGLNIWNNTILNANTAGVTLSIPGGINVNYALSYSLTLGGAGNLSLGALTRNSTYNLNPTFGGSGTITLNGANNFGAATGTISTTGTLDLNNTAALTGLSTLTISGTATIDNLTASAITLSGNPAQTWSSSFTFGSGSTAGGLNLGTGAVTLGVTPTITVASSTYGLTVGGVISGSSLGITKAGPGTLTLSGVNTYSGATTVNNGRLVGVTGGSSASSAVTVQSSGSGNTAVLGTLYTGANAQWTCSSLTTSAGTGGGNGPVLEFAFNTTPSTTTAPLKVTGTATFSATPAVKVDLGNLSGLSGTIPLLVVGGTAPTAVPTLTIVGGYSGSTLAWSGNTLNLTLSGSSTEPLKWATSTSGTWDNNDSANTPWKNSAATATYYQEPVGGIGDQVVFDDTYVTTATTVTLNTLLNPVSVTANNTANNYTVSGTGAIAGSAGLTKNGTATLTLATKNTYSGGTTIGAGTVKVGVANAIPGNTVSGDVSVTGTLDLNTFSDTINGLNGAGTVDTVAGSTPTLTVGANGDGGTFSGTIKNTAGTLSLTKAGAGTQTLSGANAYGGATAVSAGTLSLTGTSSGGGSWAITGTGSTLTINSSGTVSASGITLLPASVTGEAFNLNGGIFSVGTGGITAANSGAGTLNFNGGTLKSSGAFSISGSLPIQILAGGGTVDTTGGSITSSSGFGYGSSTGTGTFTIQGGNTFTAAFTSGSSWTGPLVLSGSGTKFVQSGATTLTGLLNDGTGTTFDLNNLSASFGGLAGAGTIVNSSPSAVRTLTITGTGGNNFSGNIAPTTTPADTAVTVNLTSGTQILSGNNTYSGATTLSGGTLQLQNTSALPSGSAFTMNSGTTLQLRANSGVTFAPASFVESGNGTYTFDVNNNGSGTGQTLILANLGQFGPGSTTPTYNLTGGNNYTLQLGSGSGGSGALNVWNNTTLNANTAGVSLSIPGGISINYAASYTLALGGVGNLSLGALTRNGTYNLTPTFGGSGTIALNGANNFGAAAGTISATGTLALNNNGALTGLSTLAFNSAVTLDNTSGGAVTISGTPAQTWSSGFTFGSGSTTGGLNLGTGAVTLGVSPMITVANSTYGLTVGGAISGSGYGLTKAGPGNLMLSGVSTFTGGTTISAGTLTIGGTGQLGSGNYAGNIANSGTFVYNSSAAQTLSGQISGTGALTQQGSGTLTLAPASGNNSYSGLTTVSGGTLVVQSSQTGTGNFTIADGADLTVTVSGTSQLQPGTLTLGSSAGATLAFNNLNSTTVAPVKAGTLSSAGTLTIAVNSGTFTVGGTYPLLTWTTGSAPAASLSSMLAIGITGHLISTSTSLSLVVDSISDIWTGGNNGNWDASTTGNWTGHATVYADGDDVLFDDTATGTTSVTVNQVVQPGGLVVNNSAKTYSLTSSSGKFIGGATSLVKTGTGTLALSGGFNTNTGTITINGGTVSVSSLANGGAASDLGSSANSAANLTLNGSTLQYTGTAASSDRLFTISTNGATLAASGTGALNLNNSGSAGLGGSGPRLLTLAGTNTAANTLAAVIGDNGGATSLTKSGTGNWTLSGANNYSGATTVSVGTLALSGSGTLGNGSSALTVSGGTLDLGGLLTPTVGAVSMIGAGTIQDGSLTGTSYSDSHTSGTATISAALLGSGGLNASGGGTLVLSGASAFSGALVINNGTVNLLNNQSGATGGFLVSTNNTSGCALNIGSAAQTAPTTALVASGQTVQVGNTVPGGTGYSTISVNGANGFATFVTNNGTLWCGRDSGFAINAYANWVQTGAMTIEEQGGYVANYTISTGGTFTYAGSTPINATVSGSANDAMTISGTFTTGQGFDYYNNGTGMPSLTLNSGGTLALSANIAQLITSTGTGAAGQLLLGTGGGVFNTAGFSTAIGLGIGNVSGQTGALTKSGLGTLTLSGANTYTGATSVSAGTLALSGTGSLTSPTISVAGGATFDVSGLGSAFTLGSSQTLTNSAATAATVNGSLNTGSGTISLSFTAGTPAFNVANGTLNLSASTVFKVNNTGAALGAGSYLLIGALSGGAVAGSLPSFAVTGGGTTAPATLQIISGQLYLTVGGTTLSLVSSPGPTNGYLANVTFTATVQTNGIAAANATGSVTFFTNGVALATNGLALGGTNTMLSNLPRGTNLIAAVYSGDGNYLGSSSLLYQVITNHPPAASVLTVTRTAGLWLLIPLANLATNWSDADGDTVELTGVNMQSTNGVNLMAVNWVTNLDGSIVTTNAGAFIFYTNGPNLNDQISYGIGDGWGGTNIGYINIVIQSSVTGTNSITGITLGGTNLVSAYGIPGYNYILERSTNLTPAVWIDISTNMAATNGLINAVDTFWDVGGVPPSSAFYQLKWQP